MKSRLGENVFLKHNESYKEAESKAEANPDREVVRGLNKKAHEKRRDLQVFKMISNGKTKDATCTIKLFKTCNKD